MKFAVLGLEAGLSVGSGEHFVRHGVSVIAQELGARDIRDLGVRELRLQAVEQGDAMRRLARVVAQKDARLIGERVADLIVPVQSVVPEQARNSDV